MSYSEAKKYYDDSRKISEDYVKEFGTKESFRSCAISYEKLGDIYMAQNDLTRAYMYYEISCHTFETLLSQNNTTMFKRDVSIIYNKLGDLDNFALFIIFSNSFK